MRSGRGLVLLRRFHAPIVVAPAIRVWGLGAYLRNLGSDVWFRDEDLGFGV